MVCSSPHTPPQVTMFFWVWIKLPLGLHLKPSDQPTSHYRLMTLLMVL